MTPTISSAISPALTSTPTEVIPSILPTITTAITSAPVAAANSFGTLAWAVLILLGGALLGIFGFLMGQGQRKEI